MAATTSSILDHLRESESFSLTSRVTIQEEQCIAVGLDNGNDAAKITVLNDEGKAVSVRIPTAHRLARTFQGGQGEVTYQVGEDAPFWIGEPAIKNEGRALRVGSTATRLSDARHGGFLAASLVEVLLAAGYEPGACQLAVGFAIPNNEVIRDAANNDKLVVADETKDALKKYLRGKTWNVQRTDLRRHTTAWSLTVKQLIPQAQTLGTFLTWAKAPNGTTITDYDAVTILDIGGGDLQQTDVTLKPYRMVSERRGEGTIDVARGLKELLPKARFNDVTAQYALVSRQALISGKMQRIDREVQTVINTYGQDLIGRMLEIFQETRRFLIVTGGGVILLHDTLVDVLTAAGKEGGQDYVLVDEQLASVLNSVGALFSVLFMSVKK